MRGHTRASLLAILEAASVSPNASQYLPSLAVAYEALARSSSTGENPADPQVLQALIAAAHEECPSVVGLEDFLPHDPRFDVRVEWAGEMFRMVAGTIERPTSYIESLRRLSAVIDPVLRAHAEYGLTDVVELVLRRINAVATALAPAWSPEIVQEPGAPPQLRAAEMAAASRVPPFEDQKAQCGSAERTSAALEAHSVLAKQLRRDGEQMTASFGDVLAIRHGQRGLTPLPAGLIAEALSPIAATLADRAATFDPTLDETWRRAVWQYVGTALLGAGNNVIGPMRDSRHPHLHSVVRYSDSQYLAVSVATALGGAALQANVEAASRCLAGVMPDSELRTVHGRVTIPASAQLCRLLIIAQPYDALLQAHVQASCAAITLQDFDWIRSTDGRDLVDLWYFVRDCIEPRNVGHIFSSEVIDKWETWKSQGKSFYTGAHELAGMFIAPDHSLLEWQLASQHRDIESALRTLGMARASEWPWRDFDDDTKLVGISHAGVLYRLVVCETPVAVALYASSGAEPLSELAYRLGNGLAYKLEHVRDRLIALMQAGGLKSLRIEFALESEQDSPLQVAIADDCVLTVGCAPNLWILLQENSRSVEEQLGVLLADAITGDATAGEFARAWNDAPPGIRVDAIAVGPHVQQTPEAKPLHESHRSARLAELGGHLEANGVEPRTYGGDEAKRLETDTIYPWLIARLHEELAPFDRVAVLPLALAQLEHTNSQRWWNIERTAYQVWSPRESDEHFHETSQELLNQSRIIGLIVEEVLARPPGGSKQPTEYDWQELLSFATLAGESSARSEVLHRELANPALAVTDLYQVTVEEDDIATSVDLGSFARDHRLAGLPDTKPIGGATEEHESDQQWAPIGERLPAYAGIEQALQASLGFGLDAILVILGVIIRWPVSTPQCTELVHPQQLAAEAHGALPELPVADYETAVAWLSLTAEELTSVDSMIKHWEVERRWARVAARPLVQDGSSVWVLPWTAENAHKAWLTYLSQLRMPIPEDALPAPVVTALRAAQRKRNREFEDECLVQLADLPLLNISRVRERDAHRHGIAHLSGEIDILSIDEEHSLILIIEAKDPFVPLSARTMHTQITQFHKPGGYVDKLDQKVRDIEASAASLAANEGIVRPDRKWKIVGIMVTRHLTPAAYMRECPTTFCTIDTLRDTVACLESSSTDASAA